MGERLPAKTGRPRKEPPANAADRIRVLASEGNSVLGVAAGMGVGAKVLSRWLDEREDLKDAFDAGREKERQTLHNVLYLLATEEKDKIAAMFLLKARHGYREGDQSEQGNRATININLPGAIPLDKFVTIENEPDAGTQRLSDSPSIPARRG